jgi:uncharacterized protein YndB with AHSA1/START domain
VSIDAPLDLVWAVMLDVDSYPEWNPFVVRAECRNPPRVGDSIVLHVRWANGRGTRSPERISAVVPPQPEPAPGRRSAVLSYDYAGLPAKLGLVRGTRLQTLEQAADGPTTYHTVEEFSGPLVRLAGPARVEEGFARHAAALKARAESLAG